MNKRKERYSFNYINDSSNPFIEQQNNIPNFPFINSFQPKEPTSPVKIDSLANRSKTFKAKKLNYIEKKAFISNSDSFSSEDDKTKDTNPQDNYNELGLAGGNFKRRVSNGCESLVCNFYKETSEVLNKTLRSRRMTFDNTNGTDTENGSKIMNEPADSLNKINQSVGNNNINNINSYNNMNNPTFDPNNMMENDNMNNIQQNPCNFYPMSGMFNNQFQEEQTGLYPITPEMGLFNHSGRFEIQPPLNFNPNDFIFMKFGKRGWECQKCNNFNFESKLT